MFRGKMSRSASVPEGVKPIWIGWEGGVFMDDEVDAVDCGDDILPKYMM